ncbi:4,5-DOPA dioxygenase extradiol [Sphingomonas sp. FW199]|uniref:4,5-DOPA-extradiol-dioxygenase n=1 Tax=Sphingomonas sp. FW199 TaxID=3400217 RepID=UPI003CF0E18D
MTRMPLIFFGHGSPTNAIDDNDVTRCWRAIADSMERPRAILCVSAHWFTQGTAVTGMAAPPTIHDFGRSLPAALFDVSYPAPGDPQLALRIQSLLAPKPVRIDMDWGLDHGTWSVLTHAFPDADIPVVQLSIDAKLTPAEHWAIGRALQPLRDEGVLIIGTGNIVHNLREMDWANATGAPYDWAVRFNTAMVEAVVADQPETVINYHQRGEEAMLSVPHPDHFLPLLYVLGARMPGEAAAVGPDVIHYKSIGMTSIVFGAH